MPRFSIRSRFAVQSQSHDRPSKRSLSASRTTSSPSSSTVSPPPVHLDTLPSRDPNGHALHYHSYTPSRYYTSIPHHRTLRRPRQSLSSVPVKPRDTHNNLHLQFDPTDSSGPRPMSAALHPTMSRQLSPLTSHIIKSNDNTAPLLEHRPETYSIEHAIRLKASALRQYLACGAELGDLSVLKQVVANHRDALARARKVRHSSLVRLHDATTLTGLPPPATAVAPPMHGTYKPTPIRAHPSNISTTTHHHHHHHHNIIRSSPIPKPNQYYYQHKKQQSNHQQKQQKEVKKQLFSQMKQTSSQQNQKLDLQHQKQPSDSSSSQKTDSNQSQEQQQKSAVRKAQVNAGRRSPRARLASRNRRAASTTDGRSTASISRVPSTSPPSTNPLDAANANQTTSSSQSAGMGNSESFSGNSSARRYVTVLSRKSTETLRRLGSAGTMFIRRFGRGSSVDDPASVSSVPNVPGGLGDDRIMSTGLTDGFEEGMVTAAEVSAAVAAATGVVSSTLDKSTLERLRTEPVEVVAELEIESNRLQKEERELLVQLKSAERVLEERRDMHDKAMEILDQFYGSLPGWQQDPITQSMFVETVDMTDAGLETERDLAEARHNMWQAHAALKDHELCLSAIQSIGEQLGLFISGLERFLRSIIDSDDVVEADIYSTVRQLEKNLEKCTSKSQMATECCTDTPRVLQIDRDLKCLGEDFGKQAKLVVSSHLYENNMSDSLRTAKSTVCECKLAENYVQERQKMIGEDLEGFEELVEKSEEYVIMERMALVDLHHPEGS